MCLVFINCGYSDMTRQITRLFLYFSQNRHQIFQAWTGHKVITQYCTLLAYVWTR
uniref:Uncharacterized protein n=1 Tax=Arundo donax TaxID=35708 RepID=A0A0A9U770_ARUDO